MKMSVPNEFICFGKNGKPDKMVSLIPAGLYDGLPDKGIGIVVSQFVSEKERKFGQVIDEGDEDVENAIPLVGFWFYSKESVKPFAEFIKKATMDGYWEDEEE